MMIKTVRRLFSVMCFKGARPFNFTDKSNRGACPKKSGGAERGHSPDPFYLKRIIPA